MRVDGSVPRIEAPTRSEFEKEFENLHKPVVITGAIRKWKAHSTWTPEYLISRIGDRRVVLKESNSHIHPDLFSRAPDRLVESSLKDYFALICSNNPDRCKRYLNGDEFRILSDYTQKDPRLQVLREDFDLPDYCDHDQVKTIGLWISSNGVVASLHYDDDGSHNLNVQVKGKKRVLLFSPSQILYPFSGVQTTNKNNFSQVNIVEPDEARFPGFRGAKCVEAVIEEGDMLFIPSYWHHAVFHEGELNINVNFWWQPRDFRLNKTSFRSTFLRIAHRAVVGGGKPFPEAKEVESAWRKLSPESQQLLRYMEELILKEYRL